MTDTERHILDPITPDRLTFCGHPPTPDALDMYQLEHVQPGGVCMACLGGVMEYERDGADFYTVNIWAEKLPQVLTETFSHRAGVWAYRLSAAQTLAQQGDQIKEFQYTTERLGHD